MADHLDSFRFRHQTELNADELDQKLIELSALFEISQTLNSSLNLKSILDNLLFVTMGRMMISKGMILFQIHGQSNKYKIETVKGLPFSLINKEIRIDNLPSHPVFLSDLDKEQDWLEALQIHQIDLLIPLVSLRNFRGVIGFGKKLLSKPYTDDEIGFLSSLSNIAIPAIENALIFEELNHVNRQLDQRIQELNTLFEIGKELNQIFNPQQILKQLSYSLMGQMLVNQFFIAQKTDDHLLPG
jgi:sigma-B regulation protein RsbU (phosphoserine phosphatase)